MSKKSNKPFKTMAQLIGIGGALGLTTMVPVLAEDLKIAEFDYIRLQASFGAVEAPNVEEDTTNGSGTNTNYEWNGGRESGYQAALTLLMGRGKMGSGGWEWGAEMVYGYYNITPNGFSTNAGSSSNNNGGDLTHQTIGVNFLGGYQWGLNDLTEFSGFVEIIPHLGGGVAFAENEVHLSNGGGIEQEKGIGWYWEAGVRVGAYITERRFIYGFNVSYSYGSSRVDMDFAGGFSSEMELTRNGLGIAGVAGYRF